MLTSKSHINIFTDINLMLDFVDPIIRNTSKCVCFCDIETNLKRQKTFAHLPPHLKEPAGLSKEYIRIYIEYKLAQSK